MVKTDYGHEKSWWDAKAKREEIDKFDEQINRALRWKEIKNICHLRSRAFWMWEQAQVRFQYHWRKWGIVSSISICRMK